MIELIIFLIIELTFFLDLTNLYVFGNLFLLSFFCIVINISKDLDKDRISLGLVLLADIFDIILSIS